MAENSHIIEKKQIRSSRSTWDDLQKLADYRNTDLTGYINAVVFHHHIQDPENARILDAIKQKKSSTK